MLLVTFCKLYEIKLNLKQGAQPIRIPARQIAFALEEPTKREITNMEEAGIISKIEDSDEAFPIVPIDKADGDVKISITDFKQ